MGIRPVGLGAVGWPKRRVPGVLAGWQLARLKGEIDSGEAGAKRPFGSICSIARAVYFARNSHPSATLYMHLKRQAAENSVSSSASAS